MVMPTIKLPYDTTFEDLCQFKRSVRGRSFSPSQFRQALFAFLRVKRAERKKAARAARKALERGLARLIAELPPPCDLKELQRTLTPAYDDPNTEAGVDPAEQQEAAPI